MSESSRRLPVYLVLDVSGSMSGEPIEAVRMGLRALLEDLQGDPNALDTVWLSVITFESQAKQLVPLTELGNFKEPNLQLGGSTALGPALNLLVNCIDKEVNKGSATQKGDWKPLVFIMTDGFPDSGWEKAADDLKKKRPGNIIACAAGPGADDKPLKRITEVVVRLQDTKPGTLGAFMAWVSASIATTSASVASKGQAEINLPALPADKGIVLVP